MTNTQPNAAKVWKQLEDDLAPRLRLSVIDKAVYAHLLRHTHLEGKRRLHFSIAWLARGTRLSCSPTRQALRRLLHHGALRLVERSKAGHVIEVRLPDQIAINRPNATQVTGAHPSSVARDLEQTDFLRNNVLRQSIHSRERGRCFYCLRQTTCRVQCLDHVIPSAHLGLNSYRNLVSSCLDCNSQKGEGSAADFLRSLYREGRLTASELAARLRALDDLAAGKLRPIFSTSANPLPRKGRPSSKSRPSPVAQALLAVQWLRPHPDQTAHARVLCYCKARWTSPLPIIRNSSATPSASLWKRKCVHW